MDVLVEVSRTENDGCKTGQDRVVTGLSPVQAGMPRLAQQYPGRFLRAECRTNRLDDRFRQPIRLLLRLGFNHHARQRLRA